MTTPAVLLPKVRSEKITQAAEDMPCAARISSFIPGHSCAAQDTVVWAHLGNLGKGTSTKVSHINGCAACVRCHDLIDGRDKRIWYILEKYPLAAMQRILSAQHESLARLIEAEIVTVQGGKII